MTHKTEIPHCMYVGHIREISRKGQLYFYSDINKRLHSTASRLTKPLSFNLFASANVSDSFLLKVIYSIG